MVLLGLVASPAAAEAWLPTQTLHQGDYYEDSWAGLRDAFLAGDGTAHIYWEDAFAYGPDKPRLLTRPSLGAWRAAVPPPTADPSGVVRLPSQTRMAITQDGAGVLHAVGIGASAPHGGEDTRYAVRAARSTASGDWTLEGDQVCDEPVYTRCLQGSPFRQPGDPVEAPSGPSLSTSPDGRGVAAWTWQRQDAGGGRVVVATRSAAGVWSPATVLASSPTAQYGEPVTAADEAGNLAVAWGESDAAGSTIVLRERRGGGGWSAPRILDTGAYGVTLTGGGNGWLLAAWVKNGRLVMARRSPGGTWTTVRDIAPSEYAQPWLGVDRAGNALVIWQTGPDVVGAHLNAGTSTPNATTIIRDAWFQDAAKPPEGRTVVAVKRENAVGVVRAGAVGWETFEPVDTRAGDWVDFVTIGIDADRNLVLAWSNAVGSTAAPPFFFRQTLYAAIFDRTPPVITAVEAPATVAVDQPAAFAVTARDTLSPTGSPRWDFGGGTTATGGTATRAFDTAGARTVTVRVADGAGNEAVAERRISVTNPAPSLLGVAPQAVRAGDPGAEITVSGRGFVPASQGRWNGSPVPTSYLAPTLLRIQVPAAAMARPGSGVVTVVNPAPGGGTSGTRTVQVEVAPDPVAPAPRNVVSPAVTGERQVGRPLACEAGQWSGSPDGYVYRWLRDGASIPGAHTSSYTPGDADAGREISCRVTAVNAGGSATATSPPVTIGAPAPVTPAAPGPAAPAPVTGTPAAVTPPVVRRPALRATVVAPRSVRRAGRVTVRVTLTPKRARVLVRLEARLGGRWLVVARTRSSASGVVTLRTRVLRPGATVFRVRWQDGAVLRASRLLTVRAR